MCAGVGVYGVGSIGTMILSSLLEQGHHVPIAVDNHPEKVGKDVGFVVGRKRIGTNISGNLDAKAGDSCEVIIHSTSSRLETVAPQISEIVRAGCNVISTCEEMSYPYLRHPLLSEELDALAVEHGVTVLGTGVNPGFLLDVLPGFASKVCKKVESVSASRIVDAATRREPLQRKIGLGLDPVDFGSRVAAGAMGHIGLCESVALLAASLRWELDEIRQGIWPVVADREVTTSYYQVPTGRVRGLRQEAAGEGGSGDIKLDLEMSVGPKEPHDRIRIEGEPPVDLYLKGGTDGDAATVGRVLNHIPDVLSSPAGLVTVLDFPVLPRADVKRIQGVRITGNGSLL